MADDRNRHESDDWLEAEPADTVDEDVEPELPESALTEAIRNIRAKHRRRRSSGRPTSGRRHCCRQFRLPGLYRRYSARSQNSSRLPSRYSARKNVYGSQPTLVMTRGVKSRSITRRRYGGRV